MYGFLFIFIIQIRFGLTNNVYRNTKEKTDHLLNSHHNDKNMYYISEEFRDDVLGLPQIIDIQNSGNKTAKYRSPKVTINSINDNQFVNVKKHIIARIKKREIEKISKKLKDHESQWTAKVKENTTYAEPTLDDLALKVLRLGKLKLVDKNNSSNVVEIADGGRNGFNLTILTNTQVNEKNAIQSTTSSNNDTGTSKYDDYDKTKPTQKNTTDDKGSNSNIVPNTTEKFDNGGLKDIKLENGQGPVEFNYSNEYDVRGLSDMSLRGGRPEFEIRNRADADYGDFSRPKKQGSSYTDYGARMFGPAGISASRIRAEGSAGGGFVPDRSGISKFNSGRGGFGLEQMGPAIAGGPVGNRFGSQRQDTSGQGFRRPPGSAFGINGQAGFGSFEPGRNGFASNGPSGGMFGALGLEKPLTGRFGSANPAGFGAEGMGADVFGDRTPEIGFGPKRPGLSGFGSVEPDAGRFEPGRPSDFELKNSIFNPEFPGYGPGNSLSTNGIFEYGGKFNSKGITGGAPSPPKPSTLFPQPILGLYGPKGVSEVLLGPNGEPAVKEFGLETVDGPDLGFNPSGREIQLRNLFGNRNKFPQSSNPPYSPRIFKEKFGSRQNINTLLLNSPPSSFIPDPKLDPMVSDLMENHPTENDGENSAGKRGPHKTNLYLYKGPNTSGNFNKEVNRPLAKLGNPNSAKYGNRGSYNIPRFNENSYSIINNTGRQNSEGNAQATTNSEKPAEHSPDAKPSGNNEESQIPVTEPQNTGLITPGHKFPGPDLEIEIPKNVTLVPGPNGEIVIVYTSDDGTIHTNPSGISVNLTNVEPYPFITTTTTTTTTTEDPVNKKIDIGFPEEGIVSKPEFSLTTSNTETTPWDLEAIIQEFEHTTSTPYRDTFKKLMKDTNGGYFTTFTTELTRMMVMSRNLTRDLKVAFNNELTKLQIEQRQLFSLFGQPFVAAIEEFGHSFQAISIDEAMNMADIAHNALKNRKNAVSSDLNDLLDFTDTLYTIQEGENIISLLDDIRIHPNGTSTRNELMRRMFQKVMVDPFIRLLGTVNLKIFIVALNTYLHDHLYQDIDIHIPEQTRRKLEIAKNSKYNDDKIDKREKEKITSKQIPKNNAKFKETIINKKQIENFAAMGKIRKITKIENNKKLSKTRITTKGMLRNNTRNVTKVIYYKGNIHPAIHDKYNKHPPKDNYQRFRLNKYDKRNNKNNYSNRRIIYNDSRPKEKKTNEHVRKSERRGFSLQMKNNNDIKNSKRKIDTKILKNSKARKIKKINNMHTTPAVQIGFKENSEPKRINLEQTILNNTQKTVFRALYKNNINKETDVPELLLSNKHEVNERWIKSINQVVNISREQEADSESLLSNDDYDDSLENSTDKTDKRKKVPKNEHVYYKKIDAVKSKYKQKRNNKVNKSMYSNKILDKAAYNNQLNERLLKTVKPQKNTNTNEKEQESVSYSSGEEYSSDTSLVVDNNNNAGKNSKLLPSIITNGNRFHYTKTKTKRYEINRRMRTTRAQAVDTMYLFTSKRPKQRLLVNTSKSNLKEKTNKNISNKSKIPRHKPTYKMAKTKISHKIYRRLLQKIDDRNQKQNIVSESSNEDSLDKTDYNKRRKLLRKITGQSSYSDEEFALQVHLKDTLLHGNDNRKSIRSYHRRNNDAEANTTIINRLSNESDEDPT